jgi:hypothetical protein
MVSGGRPAFLEDPPFQFASSQANRRSCKQGEERRGEERRGERRQHRWYVWDMVLLLMAAYDLLL